MRNRARVLKVGLGSAHPHPCAQHLICSFIFDLLTMSVERIASYSPPSSHHIAKCPKMSILSQDQLDPLISTIDFEVEEGNWSSHLQKDRNLFIVLYEVLTLAGC